MKVFSKETTSAEGDPKVSIVVSVGLVFKKKDSIFAKNKPPSNLVFQGQDFTWHSEKNTLLYEAVKKDGSADFSMEEADAIFNKVNNGDKDTKNGYVIASVAAVRSHKIFDSK